VNVPPVAGALAVNVGDFLQLMCNDKFKSMEHRMLDNRVGPRVLVACFFRTTLQELVRQHRFKGLQGTSPLHYFRL
jgi:isopenicillin N synthase-like dioxygenase